MEGQRRGGRPPVRLLWCAIALMVLTPLGIAGARQLAPSGGSPATGSAQVVTQGIAELPATRVAWRLVERTALPRGQAKTVERELGFVLASDEPILLTDRVTVGSGEQTTPALVDVARLAPGEAFLVKDGARQARATLTDRPAPYLALELVPADEVDDIGSGTLLYKSDPFDAPAGDRDLDLVRNVLEIGEQAFVPDTGASTVVLATDGAIEILPGGGRSRTLEAGESAQFDAGELAIEAVAASGGSAKRIPAAAMTSRLAQSSANTAAYVVAVIGEEIPPPPTPTPTATATPTATPIPVPTATETPAVTSGSIGVTVYGCPTGMTAATLVGDACSLAPGGFDFELFAPGGGILTLASAANDGASFFWLGLPLGTYQLFERPLPRGYVDYFIPGSAAVGGSAANGYVVTIDEFAPDIRLAVYNFQPAPTGSVTVLVFDCPASQTIDDFSPSACSPSAGGYDFRLSGDTLAEPLTLSDAAFLDNGFVWSGVPFGAYGLAATALPPRFERVFIRGARFDDALGGYRVVVDSGSPNVTVAAYNFLE